MGSPIGKIDNDAMRRKAIYEAAARGAEKSTKQHRPEEVGQAPVQSNLPNNDNKIGKLLLNFSKKITTDFANHTDTREPATAAVSTTTSPVDRAQKNVSALLAGITPQAKNNATSRGGAPVAQRFGFGGNPPKEDAVSYTSAPNMDNWNKLCSEDVKNVFGGIC